MKNSAGRYERFVLIIRPAVRPDDDKGKKVGRITDDYVVFATNLPMGRAQLWILTLPEEYRRRWASRPHTGRSRRSGRGRRAAAARST